MSKMRIFLLTLSTLCKSVVALGQNITITNAPVAGSLLLSGHGQESQILLSSNDWWGVIRAAEDLAFDFGKVTGQNLTMGNWLNTNTTASNIPQSTTLNSASHQETRTDGSTTTVYYAFDPITDFVKYMVGPSQNFTGPSLVNGANKTTVIIAGTIGKSDVIDTLISTGKLDVSQTKGKWEAFTSQVIESPFPGMAKVMVIAGSDMRGTIFGLYDVSEQIGVSPWYWWADVPSKKKEGVWANGVVKNQASPSVKYRGIFINNEQPALTNWIDSNYERGTYGPGYNHLFYSRVFELLLRLRANYFWPAMWGSMFAIDDTANQAIADAYGIIMGTSHTEPMMRATNEWTNFGTQYGGNGEWAFNDNNASIREFFKVGAQRAKPYAANSIFTMATRGLGDNAVALTDDEAVISLEDVVKTQREVLAEVFPETDVTDIPQIWCLYKEVQGYYEQKGLTVPDDVTLLWTDDDWGNIRRVPLAEETNRSGGAGIYYHIDYVGEPRNYKWINTIQLERTVEQMQLAYAHQADRIWIVNVGDLKPLEIPIQHFLDMAYDTPLWGYDSVPAWLKAWATREFDDKHADRIASVVDRYGMYAARRKYELLDPSFYSVINYNEADTILAQWKELAADAQKIYDGLSEEYHAAFYEMILQPVLGGGVVNQIYIKAAKNSQYTIQKRSSANEAARGVLAAFNMDHNLTTRYHRLLDGKWSHILDQTHLGYQNYWQQPMRNTAPPVSWVQEVETSLAGNLGVGVEGSNATVSGDDAYHPNGGNTLILPPMDPYGPRSRWIDIFSRGTESCTWRVSPWVDYVLVNPSTGSTGGSNSTDTRVYVSVDWRKAPAAPSSSIVNMNITSSCGSDCSDFDSPQVQVPISNIQIPLNFTGFVESDKHISIEAEHTTHNTTVNGIFYTVLPSHGRTLSGVTLTPVLAPSQSAETGPVLEYDIYTFTNTTRANVTLLLSPSLNYQGASQPLKYAIAIDDETPQIVQFVGNFTNGDYPPGWLGAVSDAVWGGSAGAETTTTSHDLSITGWHLLKVWALSPGVVIQKIVVDLGGVRPSYLGPPESFRAGRDTVGTYDGTNFAGLNLTGLM